MEFKKMCLVIFLSLKFTALDTPGRIGLFPHWGFSDERLVLSF